MSQTLEFDTVSTEASADEARKLLRIDGEFFIEFFLGPELQSEVPHFHKEIWELLTSTAIGRVLLGIPRDHAKTTLAKLAVVWHFVFSPFRFCVYLSNTNPIAKNAAKDIMNFIRSDNFASVFGQPKILKESDQESLWIFIIEYNGRPKKCILRAIGANQQMRGINIDNQRPDFAVIDDVEDNDNTETEYMQKKLDRWIYGPFLKALARKRKILWLGNMLQPTSLLARLSRDPSWNPVVFGSVVKDAETGEVKPLWPDRWSVEELQADFAEYKRLGLTGTWLCEMMNMPGLGVNGFDANELFYCPVPTPDEIVAAFITIDPAFGETSSHDKTAIVVHVIPEEGPPMVVEYFQDQISEAEIFDVAYRLAIKWNAWVWGIESVAAQKVLITLFKVLAATRNAMLANQIQFLPLTAGHNDAKVSRIRAFVGMNMMKQYGLPEFEMEITQQIMHYNLKKRSNRDDLLDACAYGPVMLDQYRELITSYSATHKLFVPPPKYGKEVGHV